MTANCVRWRDHPYDRRQPGLAWRSLHIKAKNVSGADISFVAGTAVATDVEYGALDVSDATVTIADTLYVGADANAVMPTEGEPLTLPVVRMTDGQSAAIGHKLRAKRVWKGLAVTLLRESADGVTTYSVRYSRHRSGVHW